MFNGKIALITGAAAGIGKATAITFAEKGAKVVIVDVDAEKLERTKAKIKEIGADVLSYVCDISNQERVNEVTEDVLKNFGKIDILVNNAAIFRCYSDFLSTSIDEWKKFIDVNIMGIVYFTKAVLPQMIENGYGKIVNVASVAGVYGNANMAHYSATKGAVISMTKALAKEVIDKGITVNCVSPGSVSVAQDNIDSMDEYEGFGSKATYIKRNGSQRENANLICFLSSDEASYIVGQNIQIDGCRKIQ